MKKKLHTPKHIESGSVRFDHIGQVEFWLTGINKLFLVVGKQVIFPSIRGTSIVTYDNPTFKPDEAVTARVKTILNKQRQIREGWLSPEEEREAWTFN